MAHRLGSLGQDLGWSPRCSRPGPVHRGAATPPRPRLVGLSWQVYHECRRLAPCCRSRRLAGSRSGTTQVRLQRWEHEMTAELTLLLSEDGADPERVETLTRHL